MSCGNGIEVLGRGVLIKRGFLLVCHTKGANHTYLPGGHVEFMEKARDSLAREIMEELGAKVRVGKFLGGVEHSFDQKGKRHCEINLVFEMTSKTLDPSKPAPSLEEYMDFEWLPVKTLAKSNLEPFPLRRLLPAWLARKDRAELWSGTYSASEKRNAQAWSKAFRKSCR